MEPKATVGRVLAAATRRLALQGIERSRLDAEVLLSHVLKVPRHALYTHPEQAVRRREESRYWDLIDRRAQREPMAYLCGEKEFFSLPFLVNRSVLIPRPETECVVEAALEKLAVVTMESKGESRGAQPTFFDVGTGSGAIAVAILVNRPEGRGVAGDVSRAALELARRNAERHGVAERLRLIEGDLFGDFTGEVDVVVSNPPYVGEADRETLPPEVRNYEPPEALLDGGDGLGFIRRLIRRAPEYLRPGGWLIFEIGQSQDAAVREILERDGRWSDLEVREDLAGIPRVVLARKKQAQAKAAASQG